MTIVMLSVSFYWSNSHYDSRLKFIKPFDENSSIDLNFLPNLVIEVILKDKILIMLLFSVRATYVIHFTCYFW